MPDASTADALVRQRFVGWLRSEWPVGTAKHAARTFGASTPTAKSWLRGQLPSNKHLLRMIQRWGASFLAHVYEPLVGPTALLRADDEIRFLRHRLTDLEIALDPSRASTARDLVRSVADEGAHEIRDLARHQGGGLERAVAPVARRGRG